RMCTSAPSNDATASQIWSSVAPASSSFEMTDVPGQSFARSASRCHVPAHCGWDSSPQGSSRRSTAARTGSSCSAGAYITLASRSNDRLRSRTRWRYVVPVFGAPMCRYTCGRAAPESSMLSAMSRLRDLAVPAGGLGVENNRWVMLPTGGAVPPPAALVWGYETGQGLGEDGPKSGPRLQPTQHADAR